MQYLEKIDILGMRQDSKIFSIFMELGIPINVRTL